MGRRRRAQITFMALEDAFAPVFRVDLRGAAAIEGYVPWQAMSTLYVALYRRWSKLHLKYENKLFYDDYKVDLTLFRKRLNVALPPSFLSPRQLMHDLVADIMGNVN